LIKPRRTATPNAGFTLIEVVTACTIVIILAAIALPIASQLHSIAWSARCTHSLRQLATATHQYLADHDQKFFPYYEDIPNGGRRWYFGLEAQFGSGGPEGSRSLDVTESPLFPYLQSVGEIEVCPAFPYGASYWKPKFKGASYGYGFNVSLSPLTSPRPGTSLVSTPISVATIAEPSKVILFGDCAQVNSFQAPASDSNPLLEEFYSIDDTYKTVHFRHSGKANMLFVDGHVEAFKPWPGTLDTRIPGEVVGRITPRRSTKYLK